jgi:hypothetical protein
MSYGSLPALALVFALIGCGSAPLDAVVIDPAGLTRDLVAHWTFDEGTGNTVGDHTGNGHDGALTGGTWLASGQFGGALTLGPNDHVAVSSFPQATASWTVSVWTRSSASGLAASTIDFSTIISTEIVFAGGWQVHLDNRSASGHQQRFDAAYWAGTTVDDYVVVSCACIEPDQWIHLTVVWDGDLSTMTLYRDDQIVSQVAMPSPILSGDTTLYMGTWSGQGARPFLGDIDDFAVWSRALQGPEIAILARQSPGS